MNSASQKYDPDFYTCPDCGEDSFRSLGTFAYCAICDYRVQWVRRRCAEDVIVDPYDYKDTLEVIKEIRGLE